jgi:hypothetical protein
VTVSSSLHDTADNGNETRDEKSHTPTELIASPDSKERAEETSGLQRRNDVGAQVGHSSIAQVGIAILPAGC